MARSLPLIILLGIGALVGCSSGAAPEAAGTAQGAEETGNGDRGDDLAPLADSATEAGDVDGIPFIPATDGAFSPGHKLDGIQFVVIHDIEGNGKAGVETFRAPDAKTSAHYVIDKFGVAVQMVHESDAAYHSGSSYWNDQAIGIEHSGAESEDGYTEAEYTASAKLVANIVTRYGIPIDRDHIVGHYQVPSTTEDEAPACAVDATDCGGRNHHQDPGQYWDWDGYLAKVKEAAAALTSKMPTKGAPQPPADPQTPDAPQDPNAPSTPDGPQTTPAKHNWPATHAPG
jgi:N-acetyl-anhydromuramyl-L-alanine amidase AmpD